MLWLRVTAHLETSRKCQYMSGTAIRVLALLLINWTVLFTRINCPWCLAQLLKHQLLCALIGWDTPVLNCFNLRLLWLYYCGVPILCGAHRCWGDGGRRWNTTCTTVPKWPNSTKHNMSSLSYSSNSSTIIQQESSLSCSYQCFIVPCL